MTIVEKLAFKDLYLTKINLSHNEISTIEPGAFENCANITSLDLSYNKIQNISKYSFDSTTYATELQLSYNLLTLLNQVSVFFFVSLFFSSNYRHSSLCYYVKEIPSFCRRYPCTI